MFIIFHIFIPWCVIFVVDCIFILRNYVKSYLRRECVRLRWISTCEFIYWFIYWLAYSTGMSLMLFTYGDIMFHISYSFEYNLFCSNWHQFLIFTQSKSNSLLFFSQQSYLQTNYFIIINWFLKYCLNFFFFFFIFDNSFPYIPMHNKVFVHF